MSKQREIDHSIQKIEEEGLHKILKAKYGQRDSWQRDLRTYYKDKAIKIQRDLTRSSNPATHQDKLDKLKLSTDLESHHFGSKGLRVLVPKKKNLILNVNVP